MSNFRFMEMYCLFCISFDQSILIDMLHENFLLSNFMFSLLFLFSPFELWTHFSWRYCPRCKEQRQASKKLDLWRLPEVLVIHLKRFSFSRSTKHKLETFVNFPIHDFDLTNYVANKNSSQRQLYELYALSNHYGNMASGHYTAHIKVSYWFLQYILCMSGIFVSYSSFLWYYSMLPGYVM